MTTTEWAGPVRFLPPPEPIFDGHDDIDAVVRRSVAFLVDHLAP